VLLKIRIKWLNGFRCFEESRFVISGFHDGVINVFALLGCYAALIGSYQLFGIRRLSRNFYH
jgi:hypothetical protein